MRAKLKLKFLISHLFEFEPRGNLHEIGQANYVIKKKNVSILRKYDLFAKLQLKLLPQKLSVKTTQNVLYCML